MNICMENLGRTLYADSEKLMEDGVYEFFETYLKPLVGIECSGNKLDVTEMLLDDFLGLKEASDRMNDKEDTSFDKKLIDAFAYYRTTGLIFFDVEENSMYVNVEKLNKENKLYETLPQKGISFRKGGLK